MLRIFDSRKYGKKLPRLRLPKKVTKELALCEGGRNDKRCQGFGMP
jgi:hypothetical protein